MKFFSTVIVSFCIIGLLIGVTPIKADAGKPLFGRGDYCWNFDLNAMSMTLQLGVTHIGGGHNLCSGLFTITGPPGPYQNMQFPAYGNLEIVGGEIYLTLSLAGVRDEIIGIDMMKAILNPDNLNGTFEWIGVYSVSEEVPSHDDAVVELSDGELWSTTCE